MAAESAASPTATAQRGPLDPRGKAHAPIGIPNTLDSLKTFVEAEGGFSPGFATYGVSLWLWDADARKLVAPTMDGVACSRGLAPGGLLIPWSEWTTGDVAVRTEVCQVLRPSPAGEVHVVAARAHVTNRGAAPRKVTLFAALRPLGPAGGPVKQLGVSDSGDALLVDGHPALVACGKPSAAGVSAADSAGPAALAGDVPPDRTAASDSGDCSGALRFDAALAPGETRTFAFICPVLPGRRAVSHQWDGTSEWAQLDLAAPNPAQGGVLQGDPGLDYYRGLKADAPFDDAAAYWRAFTAGVRIETPDPRWAEALAAILSHAAMSMNEGAPDVAVTNYNVFNRDGVYVANILQKAGRFDLAAEALDYFLAHPFNGRIYPEADNPGQILWAMGEHWAFTQDREWLRRVSSGVRQLARMIEYTRTRPGPHWVSMTSLKFGDDLPRAERRELKPGRCDGTHPEYTEAFDVAGLWRASLVARAAGFEDDAGDFAALADELLAVYDARFAADLGKGYGSYCVLWPCRLYPLSEGPARARFGKVGAMKPGGWRYFPLATAHQGLLAGRREAAFGTLAAHLDHEQMRGWYALDEGGKSGPGGWAHARTTWDASVAMPHGWAIAEFWLLMRDALLFEDGDRLVLLAGVPPLWLTGAGKVVVDGLPTYFGTCSLAWECADGKATLALSGKAAPSDGFVLRLPAGVKARVHADGKRLEVQPDGDLLLPLGTKAVTLEYVGGGAR
jgi:hypothetical protein